MSPRLAFRKATPDGLSVDIEEFEGIELLLLTKETPGQPRSAQVMGVASKEVNTPTVTWYYEYEPLPANISISRLAKWLESKGYVFGIFDQFGNFRKKAA
jgi:hypothetical protein